jgi:hypothetical protein
MYSCRYRILSLGKHIRFNTHSSTVDTGTDTTVAMIRHGHKYQELSVVLHSVGFATWYL